jgi:hypothetical protein
MCFINPEIFVVGVAFPSTVRFYTLLECPCVVFTSKVVLGRWFVMRPDALFEGKL